MWQITWMLSLLPDWFWFLVLGIGIVAILAAWLMKSLPFVRTYRFPIQILGIVCLLVGVYFQGVIANEEKYKSEHERLQKLIDEAKEQSKSANDKLASALKERDDAVAQKGRTIIQKVDRWLKGDPVTVLKDMSPEERAKFESQSKEERERFEKQIKELQDANKNCPVPSLVIQGINEAAMPPAKGEKK